MFSRRICSCFPTIMPSISRSESLLTSRYASSSSPVKKPPSYTERQMESFTAKDIEFCPNRHREVLQNNVNESYKISHHEDTKPKLQADSDSGDKEHMAAFQAQNSVSLHCVMQSNVPEPFAAKGKSPTHLNMPGSSSGQNYKYLSGQMQKTHQSKQ